MTRSNTVLFKTALHGNPLLAGDGCLPDSPISAVEGSLRVMEMFHGNFCSSKYTSKRCNINRSLLYMCQSKLALVKG